jgi:hypothetical protein
VIEALLGIASPFQRTAKYAAGFRGGRSDRRRYHGRAGVLPFANLAAGLYFSLATVYSIGIGNWASLPFLILFAFGFGFTGVLSLVQAFEYRQPAVGIGRRDGLWEEPAPSRSRL